jgi:hypothetical protein
MRNRKRTWLLRRLVFAFAVAAFVAPTAEARLEAGDQPTKVEIEAIRASNSHLSNESAKVDIEAVRAAARHTVTVRPDIEAIRALPQNGLDYGQFAYRRALPQDVANVPVQVASKPDGFDWADAGIGAGMLLGLMLLAGGATLATRHVGRAATA